MHPLFLNLPPEVLEKLLRLVDGCTLARCRLVCRQLKEVIECYQSLQYIISLGESGLLDLVKNFDKTTVERLEQLCTLNKAWRTMEPRKVEKYEITPLINQNNSQLQNGNMVYAHDGNVYVVRLPYVESTYPLANNMGTIPDPEAIEEVAMDSIQDLLVIKGSDELLWGSPIHWKLYIRKLSDPSFDHPLAVIPEILVPLPVIGFEFRSYFDTASLKGLSIYGDIISLHLSFPNGFEDGETVFGDTIWFIKWQSGDLDLWHIPRPSQGRHKNRRISSCQTLSTDLLILLCMDRDQTLVRQPFIEVYSQYSSFDPITLRRAFRLDGTFSLPELSRHVSHPQWRNNNNPSLHYQPSGTQSVPTGQFAVANCRGILDFTLNTAQQGSCDIIIRADFFERGCQRYSQGSLGAPYEVSWEKWGPKNTRIFDYQQPQFPTRQRSCGFRFLPPIAPRSEIRILDFNPYEVGLYFRGKAETGRGIIRAGPLKSFAAAGGVFKEKIRTTLPYIERRLPLPDPGPYNNDVTLMIDPEHILVLWQEGLRQEIVNYIF